MLNRYLKGTFLHGCQVTFLVGGPTFIIKPCPGSLSVVVYHALKHSPISSKTNLKSLFVATQEISGKNRIVLITNTGWGQQD